MGQALLQHNRLTSAKDLHPVRPVATASCSRLLIYLRRRRAGQQLHPVSYVVVPVIGAIICAYLLSQLDSNAITPGVS